MKKILLLLAMFLIYAGVSAQTNPTFNQVRLNKLKAISDSLINVEGSLVPLYDSAFNLGNDTNRWDTGYFDVIDANVIEGITYPDSSVLFVGSDGKPTTDSAKFKWVSASNAALWITTQNTIKNKQGTIQGIYLQNIGNSSQTATTGFLKSHYGTVTSARNNIVFHRFGGTPTSPTTATQREVGCFEFYAGYDTSGLVGSMRYTMGLTLIGAPTSTYYNAAWVLSKGTTNNNGTTQGGPHAFIAYNNGMATVNPTSIADSLFGLTVNGTAAITQTPASTNGTDSVLVKASTGQVMAVPRTSFVLNSDTVSSGNITMGTVTHYSFSGTTATWTLPTLAASDGQTYFVKNRGSGNLTINTSGGANEIYDVSAVNTYVIPAGAAIILHNDSQFFVVE